MQDTYWVEGLKAGQRVVAERELDELGEIVRIERSGPTPWIQVERYGPGADELYIPLTAIHRVVGDRVYLKVAAADLLGAAWHVPPQDSTAER